MDRIIIQISKSGQPDNTIFLVESSLQAPADLKSIQLADQSQEFKDAYATFLAVCAPLAPQKAEEFFDVVQPISVHPTDTTVTRTVYANLPQRGTGSAKELLMPLIIRHFRNGVHIPAEFADVNDVMKATNENQREVNGVMVGEFDYFYQLAQQYPIIQIMAMQIGEEDAIGRWNPAPVVVEQPEA